MGATELTLERVPDFEVRLGVRFEALFATSEQILATGDIYATVNGELYSNDGRVLSTDIEIVIAAYDQLGKMLATGSNFVTAAEFFGFHTFSILVQVPNGHSISRIRIYPKSN
jgi:hypothetical protein